MVKAGVVQIKEKMYRAKGAYYISEDDKSILFLGYRYSLQKGGYYIGRGKVFHRVLWEYYNKKVIPLGHDIHHEDFDKNNQSKKNLKLLHHAEHKKIHKERGETRRAGIYVKKICKYCGKEYQTAKSNSKHCSDGCCNLDKYHSGKANEARICIICNNEFTCYKQHPTKTCSKKCRYKLMSQKTQERMKAKKQ